MLYFVKWVTNASCLQHDLKAATTDQQTFLPESLTLLYFQSLFVMTGSP